MHTTSYLIRRSPQFPTFMRHLRHSRDVSDVRPTFATFGFQRITSHIVQTRPESFLSCLFASLVRRLAFPFPFPIAFALMALPHGLLLTIPFNPQFFSPPASWLWIILPS